MAAKPKKKNWIKKATSNAHGQFAAKAEKAGETTKAFAAQHAGDSGKTGQQARLAKTLMGMGEKKKSRRETLYDRSNRSA